jgi:shikimate dehydrogenase
MKKIVVIGYPIKHSLSPPMHNAALRELGLENEFVYEKLEVKPGKVAEFAERIRSGEIVGANVTIPHKLEMFEAVDERTREAQLIGAVNTVYNAGGRLVGHCTDGIGCMNSLRENNVPIERKTVLLIGAGGAARAIAFTLALNGIAKLMIANKTAKNAEALAKEVGEKTGIAVASGGMEKLDDFMKEASIVIHCTPVGMKHKAEGKSLLTRGQVRKEQVIMDIVYNPIKTKLLKEAEAAGARTINGTGMLVHQAVAGFEIWTGRKAPVEVMRKALVDALGEQK